MFMRNINYKVLIGIALIIIDLIIVTVVLKKSEGIGIIPLIIVFSPGLIGVFMIWYEKNWGRF